MRTIYFSCRAANRASRASNAAAFRSWKNSSRLLSTADINAPAFEDFVAKPPAKLTFEMAEGIADATQFYVRYGVSNQRLRELAKETEVPAVVRWQKMMEVYLTTQVHVIAGLGYPANEEGLAKYAGDLADCIQQADETLRDLFTSIRRDTWRELVATAFEIDMDAIPSLSIVDARNIMHKVASKMQEPKILLEVQQATAKVEENEEDPQIAVLQKHQILQAIIFDHVYLSGNPSIVEEAGFGPAETGYAKLQCAMSDHEGDPLINQYIASAMIKLWDAAGLDLSDLQGSG